MPNRRLLDWAAGAIGEGARVVSVKSLHDGYSPWLLHIQHDGGTHQVVLRAIVAGRAVFPFQIATGAAALRVAEQHGLAAPRSIARDPEGRITGVPAALETVVPGSTEIPVTVSPARLRTAGAAIAKVHKVHLEPQKHLPLRIRSLQGPPQLDTHALERRWAVLFQASSEGDKPAVIDELRALTKWSDSRLRQVVDTRSTPLLQRADDTLRAIPRPLEETVLVHADLWAGNMMWNGDTDVTLIDWKDSGVGAPGVDLGHLRITMAVQYGLDAAGHVLDGWEEEMGRAAAHVPYWDVVAGVHMPTELDDMEPGFDGDGNRISSIAAAERRDEFLRAALDQLDPGPLKPA
ncbi:MAG TPA: aminoglycoside phosphotransferase family protein [Mycobacteriales bacterium]|nr:aminoglycoside phosphotransferase family protein [Mycobacteriales bacterium]